MIPAADNLIALVRNKSLIPDSAVISIRPPVVTPTTALDPDSAIRSIAPFSPKSPVPPFDSKVIRPPEMKPEPESAVRVMFPPRPFLDVIFNVGDSNGKF